jgi:hypothetical protein
MRGEVFTLRWLKYEWWNLRAHAMDMAKTLGDFSFFCTDERNKVLRAQRVCAPGSKHTRIIIFWTLCRERRAFFACGADVDWVRDGVRMSSVSSARYLVDCVRCWLLALAHSVQHHTRARSLSQCAQHKVCWNNCNLKCKEYLFEPKRFRVK